MSIHSYDCDTGEGSMAFKYPRGCSFRDCDYFKNGECNLHKRRCDGRRRDCVDWEVTG